MLAAQLLLCNFALLSTEEQNAILAELGTTIFNQTALPEDVAPSQDETAHTSLLLRLVPLPCLRHAHEQPILPPLVVRSR